MTLLFWKKTLLQTHPLRNCAILKVHSCTPERSCTLQQRRDLFFTINVLLFNLDIKKNCLESHETPYFENCCKFRLRNVCNIFSVLIAVRGKYLQGKAWENDLLIDAAIKTNELIANGEKCIDFFARRLSQCNVCFVLFIHSFYSTKNTSVNTSTWCENMKKYIITKDDYLRTRKVVPMLLEHCVYGFGKFTWHFFVCRGAHMFLSWLWGCRVGLKVESLI